VSLAGAFNLFNVWSPGCWVLQAVRWLLGDRKRSRPPSHPRKIERFKTRYDAAKQSRPGVEVR
jgi:hypothetical protein